MFGKTSKANSPGNVAGTICPVAPADGTGVCLRLSTDHGSTGSRHMLSATCHLLHSAIVPYGLMLFPNTTSALEPKMINTDRKPRFCERMENGLCFYGAGKAHG